MKKIKILIYVFIIIIIGIIIALLIVINSSNKNSNINNQTSTTKKVVVDPPDKTTIEYKVESVNNDSTYYTIKALTENYILALVSGDKEKLESLLSKAYVEKYKVNNSNILQISNIPQSQNLMYKIMIKDMKQLTTSANIVSYIVNGKIKLLEKNEIYPYSLLIEVNLSQKKYNLYPENYIKDNMLDSLKIGDKLNDYNTETIEFNNTFNYIKEKNEKETALQYVKDLKELLEDFKDDAYEKLNIDYREKRFENKEKFFKYLNDNKIAIALMSAEKYSIIKNDEYTDYLIADKYNNLYTIRRKLKDCNFEVFLDDYTVLSQENIDQYKEYSEIGKAKYNIRKFLKMVNTKDYNSIYSVLNSSFRDNNFKTIIDLENFVKNNFYDINKIEYVEDKEYEKYYVCKYKLINQRDNSQSKNLSIIISKTDDTNFTISFSFE